MNKLGGNKSKKKVKNKNDRRRNNKFENIRKKERMFVKKNNFSRKSKQETGIIEWYFNVDNGRVDLKSSHSLFF